MPSRTPILVAAIAGLAAGLVGAELTFGWLRPREPSRPVALLYSIELRDQAGALVANPLVVGTENRRVHLSLSGESARPLELSLDLTPRSRRGDALSLDYEVRIDRGRAHSGRLGTKYGARRWVEVRTGRGHALRLALTVAKARTPAFDRLLSSRRGPSA